MHSFSEDHLIDQPAMTLLAQLGRCTVNGMHEDYGPGSLLGREGR